VPVWRDAIGLGDKRSQLLRPYETGKHCAPVILQLPVHLFDEFTIGIAFPVVQRIPVEVDEFACFGP